MAFSLDTISIRPATPADRSALDRLATLDSAPVPLGPVLLAERAGRIEAALGLEDGVSVADPFTPSAELVELLRVRAGRLRPTMSARLGAALASRRQGRALAA